MKSTSKTSGGIAWLFAAHLLIATSLLAQDTFRVHVYNGVPDGPALVFQCADGQVVRVAPGEVGFCREAIPTALPLGVEDGATAPLDATIEGDFAHEVIVSGQQVTLRGALEQNIVLFAIEKRYYVNVFAVEQP